MHRIALLFSSRQFEFCKSEEIFVIVCVLRTAESFIIRDYVDPLTSEELLNYNVFDFQTKHGIRIGQNIMDNKNNFWS